MVLKTLRAIAIAAVLGFAMPSLAAPLVVPPPVTDKIALHEINVDQGAAALVETPCGTIMIDAGGRNDATDAHLMAYLKAYFAARPNLHNRLEAFFLTHPHIDHDHGLLLVANAFEIGGYIYDGRLTGDLHGYAKKMVGMAGSKGFKVRVIDETVLTPLGTKGYTDNVVDPVACQGTDPKIRIFSGGILTKPAGWKADDFTNPNNHSLVIRIDYGKASFLFLGDLEKPAQLTLLNTYGTGALNVDVLLVPHHGADNGTTDELLSALSPKLAVISSGDPVAREPFTAWDHGHPRFTTLDRLEVSVSGARTPVDEPAFKGQNIDPAPYHVTKAIYDTAWDGDLVITADADGKIEVRTGR